jgi:hypothetical protein
MALVRRVFRFLAALVVGVVAEVVAVRLFFVERDKVVNTKVK